MRCSAADQTTAHGNTRQMAMRLAIFCSVVIGAGRSGEGSFGMPLMLRRNDCRAVKPRRSISALAGRRKAQTLAIAQQQRLAVAKSCQIQLRLTLYPQVGLATTRPTFPAILGLRIANGLPLHIGNRVRAAAGERDDVIFTVAGAGTGRMPGGRARVLPLEFPRHLTRSIFPRCDWSGHERHYDRDDDPVSRQCQASHTRSVVTTAVQKMIPSDARANSPRVGILASWPAMNSSWPSIRAKSERA